MKVILVGINSKYIHANLAIRYLKVNCDYPVTIKEFTIKDSIHKIIDNILVDNPDVIAFSVYIWNIELIKEILKVLKADYPDKRIILGGPEVSYEFGDFLKDNLTDFIIYNEGEIAFNELIFSLANNSKIDNIPNLAYLSDNKVTVNKSSEILDLNKLKNPYKLENEDYINKIQYVELSRGCPYNCAYCMASLEKKVRFFNIQRVKEDITYLYNKGARTFKFLDRTFNIKTETALNIYKFIIKDEFKGAIFQFEINGDILKPEVMDFLIHNCPVKRIRFEIGIQSTNHIVNEAVDRHQDTKKLFDNIKKMSLSNVDMHLDLIAGLPYSDYSTFKKTFNSVFKLYAKELQLGFLKLLKGTKLYYQTKKYKYKVQPLSPYEMIENQFITKDELEKIHIVEEALEIYWNKGFLNKSIELITNNIDSPFDFFLSLGNFFLENNTSFHRYQLSDVFSTLEKFLDYNDYIYDVRYDYFRHHPIKPKIYWDNTIRKNDIIREFHTLNPSYNIDKLYKYGVVTKYKQDFLLVFYFVNKKEIHILKKN